MERNARVFLTQDMGFDFDDALVFGELCILLERKEASVFNTARITALIKKRLWGGGFRDGDYLLAVGSPALIMLAGILASQITPNFNVLQWDREAKKYYSIELRV